MSYLEPNIRLDGTNFQYASWGHQLSLFGSLFAVVYALIALLGGDFKGLVGLLGGILILLVELSKLKIPTLDKSSTRGIVWILIAVVAGTGGLFTGLAILVGGIFYLLYNNR